MRLFENQRKVALYCCVKKWKQLVSSDAGILRQPYRNTAENFSDLSDSDRVDVRKPQSFQEGLRNIVDRRRRDAAAAYSGTPESNHPAEQLN
jgi:hypothetical protein